MKSNMSLLVTFSFPKCLSRRQASPDLQIPQRSDLSSALLASPDGDGYRGGWERSWTPLVSILSTGRFTRDVCSIVKQELGLDTVPGEEVEQPLKFGYFYQYCGGDEWKDTGVRGDALICCQVVFHIL